MEKSKATRAPLRTEKNADRSRGNGAVFIIAALDMSWRLAITVLVPIIGGFELDKHLNTAPVLTIIGFLIAMAGTFLILRRTVAGADDKFKPKGPRQ